jgi:hypothetical protein
MYNDVMMITMMVGGGGYTSLLDGIPDSEKRTVATGLIFFPVPSNLLYIV